MNKILYLILLAVLGVSCTKKESNKIVEPFKDLRIGHNRYEFSSKESQNIVLSSGTKISIPSTAFVTSDGSVYEGTVELLYREFSSAADIILSGIPMKYDSSGTSYDFASAGMFEIRAKGEKGEELLLDKNKNIKVDMPSSIGALDYNVYYLEEANTPQVQQASFLPFLQISSGKEVFIDSKMEFKGWSYVGRSSTESNKVYESLSDSLQALPEIIEPVEPSALDQEKFTFDMNISLEDESILSDYEDVYWQYVGAGNENSPENNDWIFKEKWNKITVTPTNDPYKYILKLKKGTQVYEAEVSPALMGKDLEKARQDFDKKLANFMDANASRIKERKRLSTLKKFSRTLSVSRLGVWNHDKPFGQEAFLAAQEKMMESQRKYKDALVTVPLNFSNISEFESVFVVTLFEFEGGEDKDITRFLSYGNDELVVKVDRDELETFTFCPNAKVKLVIPLANGQVAYLTNEDMKAINISDVVSKNNLQIEAKILNRDVSDRRDFNEFIQSI